eukprot:3062099-Pyramimonas_sp.AAC.1
MRYQRPGKLRHRAAGTTYVTQRVRACHERLRCPRIPPREFLEFPSQGLYGSYSGVIWMLYGCYSGCGGGRVSSLPPHPGAGSLAARSQLKSRHTPSEAWRRPITRLRYRERRRPGPCGSVSPSTRCFRSGGPRGAG